MDALGPSTTPLPSIPPLPASPSEQVTALAHYHRAEIQRMAGWRDRIDLTSNWSITVVAAMLSVSLSTPDSHHSVLLFGMALISLLLWIEARRYRFFDVYRARVRLLERYHFAEMFDPSLPADAVRDPSWSHRLGEDLRRPQFRTSLRQALSHRLRRNYLWMFLVLLVAWLLKIASPLLQNGQPTDEAHMSLASILSKATIGPVPGWATAGAVLIFYALLLAFSIDLRTETDDGNVHV